jgi:hypothetical protein
MKLRFLNSTLALAFLSALLFMIGYAYDVSYISRLHLPLTEYLPPTYLEIARPFYLVLVDWQFDWRVFAALGLLVAAFGILSAFWPPFKRIRDRIATFVRRVPVGFYILVATLGFLTLANWLVNYGNTKAQSDIDIIALKNWPDWKITLKDGTLIPCHYATASDHSYAVVRSNGPGSPTFVQTIPKDSVSTVEYDQSIP